MRQQRAALSALLSCILLTQQLVCSFATPAEQLSSTQEVQETTTTVEAGTTQPPSPKRWWQSYPQSLSLRHYLIRNGYMSDLKRSNALPTALWNTTAENITEACQEYLDDRRQATSHDSAGSAGCAVKYYCDVAKDYRRFPAVLIKGECKSDQECNNAAHTGIGVVKDSIGNCQPYIRVDVTVLTFQSDQEAGTDSATTNESANGKWVANLNDEHIPTNCRCTAK